jgi:glycerate-2-kinase
MRQLVSDIARAAIADCDGGALVAEALKGPHWRYAYVWAAGKAAAAMAREFGGAFVVDAHTAGHPLPDERSIHAAEQLLAAARSVSEEERALLLLSGGASAMLGAPIEGVTLGELQAATQALLDGGAPIDEINVVRRHLTLLGGGKLAAACAGAVDVLALSDVAGDDPATIGSGPAAPEPATRAEAVAVAQRYKLSDRLIQTLLRIGDNPRADHPAFARGTFRVLANPESLRAAAVARVHRQHLTPVERRELVRGAVEDFAVELAGAAATLRRGQVLVASGEPTVRVVAGGHGGGTGGRAQHLALSVAVAIAGSDLTFCACGSDGRDGPTDAAGATVDGGTAAALAAGGVDVAAVLAARDSNPALASVGALIPRFDSGTNLTDLYLLARL